jgi:phage terminase small subunit
MLTAKQEAFVQNIIKGMSQADAYRAAYDAKRMSDKTIHEKASVLAGQDKVKARINELRGKLANENIMSAQKRLEWLTRLIQNEEENTSEKLKAIDIMNKMQGEYVQKIAAEVQTETTINIELVDDDEC